MQWTLTINSGMQDMAAEGMQPRREVQGSQTGLQEGGLD